MKVTVRSGDTLWGYSRLFQVPIVLIADSNPLLQAQNLEVGQTIDIPGYRTSSYVIAAGDTIWQIAAGRGIPASTIYAVNPGLQPSSLSIGQVIRIPERVTELVVQSPRPYGYAEVIEDLNRLTSLYPFIRRNDIGESVMGKPIPEIRIGSGDKRLHVNGTFHAQEWITTPIIIRFVNEYALALTNGEPIRGLEMAPYYVETMLSIVPMVNPDGADLVVHGLPDQEPYRSEVLAINGGSEDFQGWKANIRGVDLNDQFPAHWEIEAERREQQPAPRDYPGPAPLSEPESQAMAELTRASDFSRVIAYHTQGEVIYWGFLELQPPEAEALAEAFANASGYEPIETVDSYAGYKDWFIQDWRRPGFTVELGSGVNPLPISQFDAIYEASLGIMLANLYEP
ncbi:LysM peptidoglycan-binding domain-containing protein [Paenibacillaceae bacterium]|nr:LysM peptidoglycan-binding domain-containing protein [Paenibacillaceae bacterium]